MAAERLEDDARVGGGAQRRTLRPVARDLDRRAGHGVEDPRRGLEQHVEALLASQHGDGADHQTSGRRRVARRAAVVDDLQARGSDVVGDRDLALVLADADQRRGPRCERALHREAEALARRRDLADEREAVRRVDRGQPAQACREPPDHPGLGRVRVHEVEAVQCPGEGAERPQIAVRMGVVAAERQPLGIEHHRLVAVRAQARRQLGDVLGDPAVGRFADEGNPRHQWRRC